MRSDVEWLEPGTECQPLATLAQAVAGIPATPGSNLELIDDTDAVMEAIIADVDRAERTVHMEFYIWHVGGLADQTLAPDDTAATPAGAI